MYVDESGGLQRGTHHDGPARHHRPASLIDLFVIRYYERAGLLPPPPRRSGRRLYTEEVLKRLSLIKATKSAGFTIEEIRLLTAAWEKQGRPPRDWRAFVARKLAETQTIIMNARKAQEILNAALACGCLDTFAVPLDSYVAAMDPARLAPPVSRARRKPASNIG